MEMTPLVMAFIDALAPELVEQATACRDLDRRVRTRIIEAQERWPQVTLDVETFAAYMAERIPSDRPLLASVESMAAEDLFLACACARGDSRAIAVLEGAYGRQLDDAIPRIRHAHLQADDVRQIVRRRLFVGAHGEPGVIARYSGLGALAVWLRITAVRTALNAVRGVQKPSDPVSSAPDPLELPEAIDDPELRFLKQNYKGVFTDAFTSAIRGLTARQRLVLRQSLVHHMTLREIGKTFGVHHGTVAKWLDRARQRVIDETRGALVRELKISERELDSLMGLLQSRLDVSVVRVLGEAAADD